MVLWTSLLCGRRWILDDIGREKRQSERKNGGGTRTQLHTLEEVLVDLLSVFLWNQHGEFLTGVVVSRRKKLKIFKSFFSPGPAHRAGASVVYGVAGAGPVRVRALDPCRVPRHIVKVGMETSVNWGKPHYGLAFWIVGLIVGLIIGSTIGLIWA